MRSVAIFAFLVTFLIPQISHARTAMNRCFEDHGTNEALLFKCMQDEYKKREDIRKLIEEEITGLVHKNTDDDYSSQHREDDLHALKETREQFEAYRKSECGRQKTFLKRYGIQATFEYMVCMYDMTTARIRTLQNSVKE